MTDPQQLGTARTHDELVDLLAARKDELGLSHAFIDGYWGYPAGMTDKMLGPTRVKTVSRAKLDDLMMVLGVSLVLVVDPAKLAKMEQQWEKRKPGYAHSRRVSKRTAKRARPVVWRETGYLGGKVTAHMRTPAQRSRSARHAARSRWKKEREKWRKGKAGRAPKSSSFPRDKQAVTPENRPL